MGHLFHFRTAKALKKKQAAYSVPHGHVGQPVQAGNQWWLGTDGCRHAINAYLLCARISAGRHGVGGTFPHRFSHLEYTTLERVLDKESVPRGEFRWLYIHRCLQEYEWLQWIIQMSWHVLWLCTVINIHCIQWIVSHRAISVSLYRDYKSWRRSTFN